MRPCDSGYTLRFQFGRLRNDELRNMEAGIVGLPNVGKSTLFNALTAAGIASENYPFCTIEPNIGSSATPDPRLTTINKYIETEKIIPAIFQLVDIAGLVRGAFAGRRAWQQISRQPAKRRCDLACCALLRR